LAAYIYTVSAPFVFTGAFIDDGFLIDYLTPEEYFYFIGKMYGLKKEEVDERLLPFERFMNGEVMGQKKFIRNYSAGNKQKIGIISAMLHHPQLLILDEPFNFLDPSSQSVIKHLLKRYNEEHGATVIISSHNLNHTVDVCPRIALLERIVRGFISWLLWYILVVSEGSTLHCLRAGVRHRLRKGWGLPS
jgi:ABC-2 type transport system ATP-binding protein